MKPYASHPIPFTPTATDLASLPGVVIPDVVEEGTSNDCLVLSWVEGERLTDSSAADVRELCDTLLSAYLIQLLDTGGYLQRCARPRCGRGCLPAACRCGPTLDLRACKCI